MEIQVAGAARWVTSAPQGKIWQVLTGQCSAPCGAPSWPVRSFGLCRGGAPALPRRWVTLLNSRTPRGWPVIDFRGIDAGLIPY
jgi:hypothetical protein